MQQEIEIKISEDFAVLCTFWNTNPQQIVQHYLDHVSIAAFKKRLKIDPRKKSGFSAKELNILRNKLVNDPFGLATIFTISFVSKHSSISIPNKDAGI